MPKRLQTLIVMILFTFCLAVAGDSIDETDIDQSLLDEDYPEDLDTLEEFIQSYYLLLDSDQYLSQFTFIDGDVNYIQNDSIALAPLYTKLVELRNGLRDRVSIFQIGDSHIQSGYFSGTARSSLQKHFGNKGRGLMIPLRLAGTNQPDDYRVSGNIGFIRSSNPGLAGYALRASRGGTLSIRTNDFFGIDNKHNRISFLTNNAAYKWNLVSNGTLPTRTEISTGEIAVHQLGWQDMLAQIDLELEKADNAQDLELYGMLLEREEAGLFYHSVGVNGASFRSYAANPLFFRQIPALSPDLIIISLGTNDAQGTWRAENFRREMNSFMTQLRAIEQDVPILFTLAPDTYKRRRHNSDVNRMNAEIKAWAQRNNAAWWDLQAVMGGDGSIRQWKSNALAANDMLHFSPKGYMLQGYLLYQAMLKSYKNYTQKSP